jgi:hypothetical protein
MAFRTLRYMEGQTKHMERQVELVKRQMDAMFNKEKGRLRLEIQPLTLPAPGGSVLITCIELTNVGDSKVYITFGGASFTIAPSQPLSKPDPDDFSPDTTIIEPSREEPVYVGFFWESPYMDLAESVQQIAAGAVTPYLYGFIEYETMGIKIHRDFGYRWVLDDSVDPWETSAEERIVLGNWEHDQTCKNIEYQIEAN